MAKVKAVVVNGVEYNDVREGPDGAVVLSSSKHPGVLTTSLEELSEQYGVKTAYFVKVALGSRR
jgi:hypothetical protein